MNQTEKVRTGTDLNREIINSLEIPESDYAIKSPLPLTAECVNDLESEWTVLLDARFRIIMSAKVGHPSAQYALGRMYLDGLLGVKENVEEANRWLKSAAFLGDENAQSMLEEEDEGESHGNATKS